MATGDGDRAWGRVPGARPPLPWWSPLALWVASALVLAAVVVGVLESPGPLDDEDPAQQRAGFLIFGPQIDDLGLALPLGEWPVVLVFDRRVPAADELRQFMRRVDPGAETVLVVPEATAAERRAIPEELRLVVDPDSEVADRVGLREPVDEGFPVGYAVIDSSGRVRYATLDPTYLEHPFEIEVITEALT